MKNTDAKSKLNLANTTSKSNNALIEKANKEI